MEGGSKDTVIPSMAGLTSDGVNAPEIRCRPSSMTSVNISDGNKRSQPASMNAVICKGRGCRYSRLDGTRARVKGQGTGAVDS